MQDRQIMAPFDSVSQKCSVTSPTMRNASTVTSATTKNTVVCAGVRLAGKSIVLFNGAPVHGSVQKPRNAGFDYS